MPYAKHYDVRSIGKIKGDGMPDIRKYMRDKKAAEAKRRPADTEDDFEGKLRAHRVRVFVGSLAIILVAIALALLLYILYRNKKYEAMEVVQTIAREESMQSQYVALNGNILRCSRDGAACVSDKGETIWDLTYEMKQPLVDVCEDYAVIAEASGNKVFIVNTKGKQGELETLLPIRQVRVAAQGMVVVVLEDGDKNWINFYDKDGKCLAENKAPLSSKGYPLSVDVSRDGKKLAVSYLQIQGASIENIVAFYNFDSVGYNVTDHLMSSTLYEGTVIPTITFLNNNLAVAFGDNQCIGYEGTQNPEEIFQLHFEEEIESIFYNEDYIGFVFRNNSSTAAYRMEVYNKKGKKLLNKAFQQEYDTIKFIGEEIVLFSQRKISIYSINGRLKYSGELEKAVSDVMGTGKAYQYMMLYKTEWEKVKLK